MNSIKDFYCCGTSLSSTNLLVTAEDLYNDDELLLIQGNYNSVSFPIVFKQEKDDTGTKTRDIIETGWPNLYLISPKLLDIFTRHSFIGFTTYPVIIFDKKGAVIEGYYGLSITGRCGSIDYKKSKIIKKKFSPDMPAVKYFIGLYIGLDKWDGSDIFIPGNSFQIIMSNEVVKAIKKEKITNIKFENLSEIETPEYGILTR